MTTVYDAYEIHPVTVFTGKDGQPCHDITTRPDEADLWCLYGHIPSEGLECIGDFPALSDALRVYERITGRTSAEDAPASPETRLVEALRLALLALNSAPRFRIQHPVYRDSYAVCAAVEAALRQVGGLP